MNKRRKPDFRTIIALQASRGFSFHVFQDYGEDAEVMRGFSKSFTALLEAVRYARRVPGGMVYDSEGNPVN